jgi:hypothetical protein
LDNKLYDHSSSSKSDKGTQDFSAGSRGVAQWYSACLDTRPYIQSPALGRKKTSTFQQKGKQEMTGSGVQLVAQTKTNSGNRDI